MNNTIRKEGSIDAIKIAIASLNQQDKKVTQQNVAELTKGTVSISTIRRHWKDITPLEKISIDIKKISPAQTPVLKKVMDDFEQFKRRANASIIGLTKLNPDMF